ncbi:MAG: PP2C family protein-serine/threonine phosphatase, partial [Deltaproteobacteria bacterium]
GSTLTVLVGDATGHGAAAAIVTAVAKSCFSTLNSIYSKSPLSPEIFLEKLNQVIFDSCKGQLLMTMAVIQIDLHSGEAVISNAGHEAPLLLNPPNPSTANPKCEPLFLRGERLGFSLESKFETLKVQLSVGDTILIYTDGVSEAVNEQNKQFGERAIKKLFNKLGSDDLSKIKTQLYDELKTFMRTAPQLDDITYVLLRWKYRMDKIEAERVLGSHSAPSIIASSSQQSELNTASEMDSEIASAVTFEKSPHLTEAPYQLGSETSPEPIPAPLVAENQPLENDMLHESLSAELPSINDTEQSVIRLAESVSSTNTLSKTDLNQLAKKTDFADEEIDTHYSRLTELDEPDSGTSGGEAA